MNHLFESDRTLAIQLAGEEFVAMAERALYWPREEMLMIADLHLGKSDTFRAFGMAVPQAVQQHDLLRLHTLLARLQPRRLVVLGDFVHGSLAGQATRAAWSQLREAHGKTELILTRGNHDRVLLAQDWRIDAVVSHLQIGNVVLSHEPLDSSAPYGPFALNVHGHVHPVFRGPAWGRALPAMVYENSRLVLPAFSAFTGGVSFHTARSRLWVFAEDAGMVVPVQ